MLDDLKYIHNRDKSDALGIAEKQWQQLEHEFEVPKIEDSFNNIVVAGMGGSALAARLSLTWPGFNVPFEIVTNYHIPKYVSAKTLFIASSYSGNTEETVSALHEAATAKAKIVVVTSGGKLAQLARDNHYPFIKLPEGMQPRFAVFYNFKALVTIFERAGLVKAREAEKELLKTAEFLKKASQNWLPTVPTSQNQAKQIAQDSIGLSPVIYAGPLLAPAAYKWKIDYNENAKQVAWWNHYPEFNHNEFMGWVAQPVDKPYRIIDLTSRLENERVQKRFKISEKLLSGKRPFPITIQAQGDTVLEHLLWTVLLGDFVTLYTALLNNVDPTPVELVEKLKKELNN